MAWVLQHGPGTLLHEVQQQRLYTDSKHFVDLPLRHEYTVQDVMSAFQSLPKDPTTNVPSKQALLQLVSKYFYDSPSQGLLDVVPPDLPEQGPDWVQDIYRLDIREFVVKICSLWKLLYRQVAPDVHTHPECYTLLTLPHPFIIAGDRFRECYYWDSYWAIRGLLACGMTHTARNMVLNMLYQIDTVGHVPNGTRCYYTNRSQPPFLSAMVMSVSGLHPQGPQNGTRNRMLATQEVNQDSIDMELLELSLPRLIKTWQYRTTGNKAVQVRLGYADVTSKAHEVDGSHSMCRYWADWTSPRPESYREDWDLAVHKFGLAATEHMSLPVQQLWQDIASAAESGWDFSSRWCDVPADLSTIHTTQVIPADLNALIAMLASDISCIAHILGQHDTAAEFAKHAKQRWDSLNALMWDEQQGCWQDCRLALSEPSLQPTDPSFHGTQQLQQHTSATSQHQVPAQSSTRGLESKTEVVFDVVRLSRMLASNWVPLWAGAAAEGSKMATSAVAGLQSSGLIQPGGLMTSKAGSERSESGFTGHQWDAPNAWPPLQHMAVEALQHAGVPGCTEHASKLAQSFLSNALLTFKSTGHMHEKYDALKPGEKGGGGEYEPQVGFGWTNGVVLDLIKQGYLPS